MTLLIRSRMIWCTKRWKIRHSGHVQEYWKFFEKNHILPLAIHIRWIVTLKCRWSITSIGNAELLRCPMEYYRIFMGCITIEVLSFFAFWWTECICLSICKSQGNLFLCHAILVQSFAGDGSSEIFCSLIFCRGRHCRQVRQGVVSPCHTCGTWRITWWGLNATEYWLADK